MDRFTALLRTRSRSARLASAPSPGVARLLEAAHSSRQQHDLQQVAARCGLTVMQVRCCSSLLIRAANDPSVFTITEKAPTSAFTFMNLLKHYAKWAYWALTHSKTISD